MTRLRTSCDLRIGFSDRSLVKGVLAELAREVEGDVHLRRGRITDEASWVDVELRTAPEEVEKAFLVLARPGVTVQSFSAPRVELLSMDSTLSPTAGGLTRPPAEPLPLPALVSVC